MNSNSSNSTSKNADEKKDDAFRPQSNGYTTILSETLCKEDIISQCISGKLRTLSIRSIVWRINLRCLPLAKTEWIPVLARSRANYHALKKKNITDPHDEAFSQDPQLNNPLDQAELNPWQQYFADNDLRDIITKDVERTFPEIEFFQQTHIRQMMADILLIFAKENSFIAYKQGMHEILAPMMFVLYCDQQNFIHSKENGELRLTSTADCERLQHVFASQYLEHDSYAMFSEIMLEVSKWYEEGPSSPRGRNASGPYMRMQDEYPTSHLMTELAAIGERLSDVDPLLAAHLNSLDIVPQLYGIRWLRLLFGREFPIHDLLYLWDVIICDRPIPRIVECIFVAMLVQIKDLLMYSDYGGCLQYLMRYPPIVDVSSFLQLALHFRSPNKIPRPSTVSMMNFSNLTVAGKSHPNQGRREAEEVIGYEEPPSARNPKSVLSIMKNTIRDRPVSVPNSPHKSKKKIVQKINATSHYESDLHMMEEQINALQSRLNEKDVLCSEAARVIDMCAREITLLNGDMSAANTLQARLRDVSNGLRSSSSGDRGAAGAYHLAGRVEMAEEAPVKRVISTHHGGGTHAPDHANHKRVIHVNKVNEMIEMPRQHPT